MTAAADVLVEISLARTGTSAAIHLGMREIFFFLSPEVAQWKPTQFTILFHQHANIIAQVSPQVCGGNPATTRLLRRLLLKDALLLGGNSPAGRRPSAWLFSPEDVRMIRLFFFLRYD